jgi:hypothetical protein
VIPNTSEFAHIISFSDILVFRQYGIYNSTWYGLSFVCLPWKASFSVNLSGSQVGGFLIFPELSNPGSPPAQPGVYLEEIKTINPIPPLG